MDLSFNLAPNYRDLKDPTTRQNFDDTVEQKRVIDLRACHMQNVQNYAQCANLPKLQNMFLTLCDSWWNAEVGQRKCQNLS